MSLLVKLAAEELLGERRRNVGDLALHVVSRLAALELGYLFGADESYIETFYNTIDNDFGGMDAFLRDRLGVTEEKKAALRSLYLT